MGKQVLAGILTASAGFPGGTSPMAFFSVLEKVKPYFSDQEMSWSLRTDHIRRMDLWQIYGPMVPPCILAFSISEKIAFPFSISEILPARWITGPVC